MDAGIQELLKDPVFSGMHGKIGGVGLFETYISQVLEFIEGDIKNQAKLPQSHMLTLLERVAIADDYLQAELKRTPIPTTAADRDDPPIYDAESGVGRVPVAGGMLNLETEKIEPSYSS